MVVYSEVWLESEKELSMLPVSSPSEISTIKADQSALFQSSASDRWHVLDETVFLNQLHSRASILNADFQRAVLDRLCLKLVKQISTSDDTDWSNMNQADAESFFRDSDLYDTEYILAESPLDEGFRFQRTMSGSKDSQLFRRSRSDLNDSVETYDSEHDAKLGGRKLNPVLDLKNPTYSFTRSLSADSSPSAQLGFPLPVLPAGRNESLASTRQMKSVPMTTISKISVLDFFKKLKLKAGFTLPKMKNADLTDSQEAQSTDSRSVMMCSFSQGPDLVAYHTAPTKEISRMREKLLEYSQKNNLRAGWPLTANILDPVRVSIVCNAPSHILEVKYSSKMLCLVKFVLPACSFLY